MNILGLYHIILISFKSHSPKEVRDDIYNRYQTLADECGGKDAGILFWKVEKNIDLRKNVHLIEFAVFSNIESLERFKKHEKHTAIVEILKDHADWQVGNFFHT